MKKDFIMRGNKLISSYGHALWIGEDTMRMDNKMGVNLLERGNP